MTLETTLVVKPARCKQQRDEFEQLIMAADDIGSAAVCTGAHGYDMLVCARTRFRQLLVSVMDRSRYVEEHTIES